LWEHEIRRMRTEEVLLRYIEDVLVNREVKDVAV
jgi:hypothetical protein